MCKSPLAYGGPSCSTNGARLVCAACHAYCSWQSFARSGSIFDGFACIGKVVCGKFSVDLIDAVQNGRSEGARRRRAATAARRMARDARDDRRRVEDPISRTARCEMNVKL